MRLHGGERRVEAAAAERPHLVQRAGGEHGIEAGVDPAVELGAVEGEEDLDRSSRIERGRHAVAMPVGQRTAGRQDDFERAGDAGAVAGHQPARGDRIALGELGIERSDAVDSEPPSRTAARTSGGIGGTADSPRVSALKYSPEPPTKIGRRPARSTSASAAPASTHQRPTE